MTTPTTITTGEKHGLTTGEEKNFDLNNPLHQQFLWGGYCDSVKTNKVISQRQLADRLFTVTKMTPTSFNLESQ